MILLLTESTLKRYSPIEGNVDVELLKPHILRAQETIVHETLGTDLLRELQSQIENDTVTAANATLLDDYIRPMLALWSTYKAMPFLRGRIRNGDIVTRTHDDGTPVSDNVFSEMINGIKNDAEWYTQRTIDFLCNNEQDYPAYKSNTDEDICPKSNGYNTGLVL